MKSFTSKLAFTIAVLAALFGPCRSGFAVTVQPGDGGFDISISSAGPFGPPWDQVYWGFYLLSPAPPLASIQLDIFDSSNTLVGTSVADYTGEFLAFYPEFIWVSDIGAQTSDPAGHVHFTILNGIFALDLSRSFAYLVSGFPVGQVIPLPATLPLFASGLGALGLLGWRKKRKQAA